MAERSDAVKRNLKRYLDAGSALSSSLSKMTRADLEHALRDLSRPGSEARAKADDVIEEMRARSRRGAGQFVDHLRGEFQREIESVVSKHRSDLSDLAERAVRLVGAMVGHTPSSEEPETTPAGRRASTGKKAASPKAAAPKRAPAKKTAPGRAAATKSAAAKRPAKANAAAKKAPGATKTAGTRSAT
jgi:vacuolar-type H+-ATPase subunit H